MGNRTACFLVCLLCFLSGAYGASGQPGGPPSTQAKPSKDVVPTDWGGAIGRVYDARTGAPISEATVVVQQDGEFAASGRTVGKTNDSGKYRCDAMLGRITSKIEGVRLLSTGLIGLLSGGAKKVTKRVDVTQLNLRVSKEGYHPFEGVVSCRRQDPKGFGVYLEPILLTPVDGAEISTVAPGWNAVQIMGVSANPSIVRAGSATTISANLKCPPIPKPGDVVIICKSPLFGSKRLSLDKNQPMGGPLTFSGQVTIKSSNQPVGEMAVTARAPYELGDDEWSGSVIYLAADSQQEKAAQLRMRACALARQKQNVEACAVLKELCSSPEAGLPDHQLLARISEQVHDYPTAVACTERVVKGAPEKGRMAALTDYAEALVLAGQPETVVREIAPQVEKIKDKDRLKKVPVRLMVAVGSAYRDTDKFEQARAISDELAKWPQASTFEGVRELRRSLRLAETQSAIKNNPKQAAAWADYGRVLMDMGRWEEAVENLRQAVALDPSLPAVQWDLGYALLQITGAGAEAGKTFDQALAEAEQAVIVGKDKRPTKDFFAWHRLGLLLYRKASEQAKASDSGASATFIRSREALTEALRCGRSGAAVSEGGSFAWGYHSPKVVAISGFAYPEADADYLLLNSLEVLANHPQDYLAHFNSATALIDLKQWDLAAGALEKAGALKPDFAEAKYVSAQMAIRSDDTGKAVGLLQEVLAANPRHPGANQELAKLYTDQGDMAAAAACLAAHDKYYGRPL